MNKELDITGYRFGKLVAIKRVQDYVAKSGIKIPQWLFKCDCGNEKIHKKHKVVSEKMVSCGCTRTYYKDRTIPNKNALYSKYKRRAKLANLEFDVPQEVFEGLVAMNCYYCNRSPYQVYSTEAGDPFKHNGLDRVDSNQGYTLLNVVPCCKECNYAKHSQTKEGFLSMVKRIYEHLKLDI
jgi:hypothetical protein